MEKVGIQHGKTKIRTSWWHVINSTRSFRCSQSTIVQHLVVSWQKSLKLFNWKPPECRKDCNSLPSEVIASSRLLQWDGKDSLKSKFNRMAKLGLVTVEDGILESQRQMMAFRTVRSRFHIPPGYGQIWQTVVQLPILSSPIPQLVVVEPWKDWFFDNNKGTDAEAEVGLGLGFLVFLMFKQGR